MSKISVFFKRERLYILILIFVSIVTATIVMAPYGKSKAPAGSTGGARIVNALERAQSDRVSVEKVLKKNRHLASILAIISLIVVALFFLGIIIDSIFLMARFAGKNVEMSTYKLSKASWGVWDVSKVVILYMFFSYMLLITESFLASTFPMLRNDKFRMILNSSIMDILSVALILHFTIVQYGQRLVSLGLSAKNFFRNVYYGLTAYIALVPILIGITAVTALLTNLAGYTPQKQPVVDIFLRERSTAFLLYTSLFAAVAGPIIEEIFFRGFFYSAIKKYIGVFWATLITAAMFAGLHAHLVGFMPILALGILLAYLYEKTGTLVSSITVHVIHNVGMVLLVFFVKQLGVY